MQLFTVKTTIINIQNYQTIHLL